MIDFLVEVNARTKDRIEYLVRMEPGVQTPEETLTIGSGSCRDSAWLMVESFRQVGMAARFVSGYLIQLTRRSETDRRPRRTRQKTFAICMLGPKSICRVPVGWGSIRPAGCLPAKATSRWPVRLAYTDAAPITGGHEACEVEFDHQMTVRRAHEDPRVTKPYTDQQWEAIMATGREVDRRLERGDVPLDDRRRTDLCFHRRHG